MKITKIKIGILLIIAVSGVCLVKFNIINVENLNFFSRDITQNIVREGYLDEVWDFEKVPSKDGYYNWVIGVKAEEVTAARVASGTVVTFVGNKELNMDYKSMEDYNKRNGNTVFRNFIEEYSAKND